MSDKLLYIIWAGLYILCAGLGFIQEPEGVAAVLMTLLSLAFFVPGFVLVYRGKRKVVGSLSLVSLVATLAALVLNVLSVAMSSFSGDFLYTLLGLVSAPMYCSRVWVLSLFLWACLLMASLMKPKKD